jgi:TetR/AcrR family fatty acid metabolism transcriptional regulator
MKDGVTVDMRKRIIEAAILIAAQSGFTKATTKDIAKKGKCSEGIIYHYFKSKHELFFAVIKENAEKFREQLQMQLEESSAAKDKLERLIDFHFLYFTRKSNIFQILFGKSGDAMVPFSYLLKVVILPYQRFIEGVIKKGIDSGEFQRVNAVVLASSLLGMMQFNITKIHFGVNDTIIEEVKDLVKHLVFKALLKTK